MLSENLVNFISLNDLPDCEKIIDDIWSQSKQGWIWNTVQMFEFRKSCLPKGKETKDLSFVIYKEGKPIGFFFLLAFKSQTYFEATFSAPPLYWPCFIDQYIDDLKINKETFAYIDGLCMDNNIGLLKLMLRGGESESKIYRSILAEHNYIDESYESHIVKPKEFNLSDVRAKYRQMVRKYTDKFVVKILLESDITEDIIQQYHKLHVLDSGGNFRDLNTYYKQFELFQKGGFVVCAFVKENDTIPVGMLHILLSKNEAYDSSVAVNPEYHKFYLSHILKFHAIQYMQSEQVEVYELGQSFYCSTLSHIPSKKNYGINYFKDGWSGGRTRRVYKAIKFYQAESLNDFCTLKVSELKNSLLFQQ
jgi:hypothetical protein